MLKKIVAATLVLGVMPVMPVVAQDFPSQTISLIVPYAAGGSSDALARALGQAVSRETGQSVVVENRPGGATVIGAQALLAKPADGHSLLLIAASFTINPHLIKSLPYDTAKDFSPVTQLASNPHVLVVSPKVPATTLKEYLAWAKEQGDRTTFSSFGNGSSGHLGFELLKRQTGLKAMHVPYKGAAPATMAVLSGEVDATLGDVGVVGPHIKAGKLRAIAVTGEEPSATLPDVPTFDQAGLSGFSSKTWMGLLTRQGVPADRVERLSALFSRALQQPDVQAILAQQGMRAEAAGPARFAEFMASEGDKYGTVVREAGISID